MVDGVVFRIDKLGDGHHGQAALDETFQHIRQGGGRVEGGVVEQHDAAGLHLVGDAFADGGRVVVFPVQAVTTGNKGKPCGTRVCKMIGYSCISRN